MTVKIRHDDSKDPHDGTPTVEEEVSNKKRTLSFLLACSHVLLTSGVPSTCFQPTTPGYPDTLFKMLVLLVCTELVTCPPIKSEHT